MPRRVSTPTPITPIRSGSPGIDRYSTTSRMIDDRARRTFGEQGYVVARALFDADETAFWRDHFMRLREAGAYPGDVVGVEPGSDDPLKKYPRMIHMHRWDAVAPRGRHERELHGHHRAASRRRGARPGADGSGRRPLLQRVARPRQQAEPKRPLSPVAGGPLHR